MRFFIKCLILLRSLFGDFHSKYNSLTKIIETNFIYLKGRIFAEFNFADRAKIRENFFCKNFFP